MMNILFLILTFGSSHKLTDVKPKVIIIKTGDQIKHLIEQSEGDERWPVVIDILRNMTDINNYLLNKINQNLSIVRHEMLIAAVSMTAIISIIFIVFQT